MNLFKQLSILLIMLFWLIFIFIRPAMASCTVGLPSHTSTMPLQLANITAGPDLAVGTVLYKQTYNININPGSGSWVRVTCTTNAPIMANYSYTKLPLPLSPWGSGLQAGKVYETGVPGVGFYVGQGVNGTEYLPTSKPASDQVGSISESCQSSGSCTVIGNFVRWDIYFVKTGPISPGVITGGNLPCVGVNYTNDVNSPENEVVNACMTGSLNVAATTCKTPDVTVPMGTYDASSFTEIGSATKWIDASIKLTDCPVYYGYGSSGQWYVDSAGANSSGNPKQNSLTVKLNPTTTVINSSSGIFSLTPDTNSASGVGIQLAYGNGQSPVLVNFSNTTTYKMGLGTTGITSIPLVARYIQTDKHVTPGTANSAVTFLINYY